MFEFRRVGRLANVAMVGMLALGAGGCTMLDNALAAIPFFSFMHEAPSIDPYEMTRAAPPGSVPYASPAGEYVAPYPNNIQGLNALAEAIEPPAGYTAEALENGALVYARHCAVCHGVEGAGNGPLAGPGKFPVVPNLAAGPSVTHTDGYIYAVIRQGRGLMPPYGERMSHDERWNVVGYVRQLQQAAGAAAPATNPPAAGTTPSGEE